MRKEISNARRLFRGQNASRHSGRPRNPGRFLLITSTSVAAASTPLCPNLEIDYFIRKPGGWLTKAELCGANHVKDARRMHRWSFD